MAVPTDLKYTEDHEWVKIEDDLATMGITDYAQEQLGGLVYVNLPSVGDALTAGDAFGEVESVKSVSELLAPLSGTVSAVNVGLEDAPETLNSDPYDTGWIIKITLSDPAEAAVLMDSAAYEASLA